MKIDFPEVLKVSYSRIKTWRRCQMKHYYRYVEKLRRTKKPVALYLGSAIHSCIEYYHEGKDWREYLKQFESEFNKLFIEEREELGDIPSELKVVMENYFDFYSEDGLVYPARRWGQKTEFPIKVWLDSRTLFIGYIDAFPEDSEGRTWIMDHKSFTKMPDEVSRFSDYQFVVYYWLAPQIGYPQADGIIWDYVRKKAPVVPETLKSGELSKAKNQDTTYSVYMAKAVELFGKKKAMAEYDAFAKETFTGREEKFFNRVYLPNPHQTLVNNVVNDLLASIEEIRQFGKTSKVRSSSHDCGSCEYFNLCSAELRGLDTDYMRKADYFIKGENDGSSESETE